MTSAIAQNNNQQFVKDCIKAVYMLPAAQAVNALLAPEGVRATCEDDLQLLTLCIVVLNNGFTVVGQSACADPEMYDEEIGRKLAYADALKKVEPYLGFLRKQDMYEEELMDEASMLIAECFNEDYA